MPKFQAPNLHFAELHMPLHPHGGKSGVNTLGVEEVTKLRPLLYVAVFAGFTSAPTADATW